MNGRVHSLLVADPLLALPKAPGRTTPGFRDGSRATFSFLPFMVRDESIGEGGESEARACGWQASNRWYIDPGFYRRQVD